MNRPFVWLSEQLDEITQAKVFGLSTPPPKFSPAQLLLICLLIFVAASSVRLLAWSDNWRDVGKVQTYVTSDYKRGARQLMSGNTRDFLGDLNNMGHPPGYPILLAGVFTVFNNSDTAVQFLQMICDAGAVLMVFLIALELLPGIAAIIAGMLAALSPQFAYHSVVLLPDSLAALPILLAVYFMLRALQRPRLLTFAFAGALVGLSCWLRANALLLAPFLAAAVILLQHRRSLSPRRRSLLATALLAGAVIVIAPITIKNFIVFHSFIPLSLGAGQTMLEGIADYDAEGKFNIPKTDLAIIRQEAEWYRRPDYAETLFGPDGIQRERRRIARGLAVIRSHPAWYAKVVLRRGMSSLRLDRVHIVHPDSPVSHSLESVNNMQLVWATSPGELINRGSLSPQVETSLEAGGEMLRVIGDSSKYGAQVISTPIAVVPHNDYVLRAPFKLEQGRAIVRITGIDETDELASTDVEFVEGVPGAEQAFNKLAIPFVSGNRTQVRLIFGNNASSPAPPVELIGRIELFNLGPSSYRWMHYPRLLVRALQKLFITAVMLPLAILGVALLVGSGRWRVLVILLVVPCYYLSVQSLLHTERRYVLAIHYFLSIIVALTLALIFNILKAATLRLLLHFRQPATR